MLSTSTSSRHLTAVLPALLLLGGLSLSGCGGGEPAPSTSDATPTPVPSPTGTPMMSGGPTGEDPKITAALADLSPEDQAAARAQKVCPVSGESIGSMGPPVIVMAGERKVFLCCDGCKKDFEDNPEKYVAKLSGGESESAPEEAPKAEPEEGAKPEGGESGT